MRDLAGLIDHTLLKPDATSAQIARLCAEAAEYGFYSVCVNSSWVSFAVKELSGTEIKVAVVTGFPLGAMSSDAKAFETGSAIRNGASEIDTVLAIGRLKENDVDFVLRDLSDVVAAAAGRPVKVILETCLLTRDEKLLACRIAMDAGASFVKTSTGFSSAGATLEDVRLMRECVGKSCGVKASGGIKDRATAEAMIAAGAIRLGTSSSIAIISGESGSSSY